jgi:hypothetical protein
MKYANGTPFTQAQKSAKFQYYEEDCLCADCLHDLGKDKSRDAHCGLETCCCADIRAEAVKAGRINRPKGWWAKQCRDK